jgi:hypothetical protein
MSAYGHLARKVLHINIYEVKCDWITGSVYLIKHMLNFESVSRRMKICSILIENPRNFLL